jgi:hypothetical protein
MTGVALFSLVVPAAAQSDSTKVLQSPVILNADSIAAGGATSDSASPALDTPPSSTDQATPGTPLRQGRTVGHANPDTSFWQKPTGALFKSIIAPGWGQYANGKYQKAAIICGLESFFIVKSVQYFVKTRDRFDTFKQTQERADFDAYDNARSNRNKYYWFVAGTIFYSMWDAFADAHLKPFEEIKDDAEFWGLEPGDRRRRVSPPELSLAWTVTF